MVLSTFAMHAHIGYGFYRARKKGTQILLSNSQAGPSRTVKQKQEEISRNHVHRLYSGLCIWGSSPPQVAAPSLHAYIPWLVMQRKCFRADRSGRKFAVRSSEPTFGIKTVLSLLIRTFVYDRTFGNFTECLGVLALKWDGCGSNFNARKAKRSVKLPTVR